MAKFGCQIRMEPGPLLHRCISLCVLTLEKHCPNCCISRSVNLFSESLGIGLFSHGSSLSKDGTFHGLDLAFRTLIVWMESARFHIDYVNLLLKIQIPVIHILFVQNFSVAHISLLQIPHFLYHSVLPFELFHCRLGVKR